jgi:hypothetical protein
MEKLIPAAGTAWAWGRHLKGAAFDLKRVPLGQGQGHLATRLGDDALKSGTRNAHAPSRLSLGQAFQVSQAQGFQFLVE